MHENIPLWVLTRKLTFGNAIFPKTDLLESMGFPINWRDAASLPV